MLLLNTTRLLFFRTFVFQMPPKIYTGPQGGRYYIVKGRKVYLKSKTGRRKKKANVVSGVGAYRRGTRTFGPKGLSRRIKGKGGFFSDIGRGVDNVGNLIGKLTGLGDYNVGGMKFVRNSLLGMDVGGTNSGVLPTVSNKSDAFIVTHKEFLGNVSTAGAAFAINGFKINPGLSETFPWLANIAVNFMEWEPLGIVFQYKTTSVDALNSTDTGLGSVLLATDYNSSNPNFSSKEEMDNTTYVSSTKPSCSVLHPIECSPSENTQKIYFVRQGGLGAGQDPTRYDLGNFQIATVGNPEENVTLGELWVSYQIRFRKPYLTSIGLGAPQYAHWSSSEEPSTDKDNLFADMTSILNNTSIQIQAPNGTGGTLFDLTPIPGSRLLIMYRLNGGTGADCSQPAATLTGCTSADIFINQTVGIAPNWNMGGTLPTNQEIMFTQCIDVDSIGTPWTVAFDDNGVLPGSVFWVDLFVFQLAVEAPTPDLSKMGPVARGKYLADNGKKLPFVPTNINIEKMLKIVGSQEELDKLIVDDMVAHNKGMTKLMAYGKLMEERISSEHKKVQVVHPSRRSKDDSEELKRDIKDVHECDTNPKFLSYEEAKEEHDRLLKENTCLKKLRDHYLEKKEMEGDTMKGAALRDQIRLHSGVKNDPDYDDPEDISEVGSDDKRRQRHDNHVNFQEIQEVFEYKDTYVPTFYYPSIERIIDELGDLESWPKFLEQIGSDLPVSREMFEKQCARFKHKGMVSELKNKFKGLKPKTDMIVVDQKDVIADMTASQLIGEAVKKVAAKK